MGRNLPAPGDIGRLKPWLEAAYRRYNRAEFAAQDPVRFLHEISDPGQREVAGLLAAVLAYGRLAQIMHSVADALERLGPWPRDRVMEASESCLRRLFAGFRHRFSTGEQVAALLCAAGELLGRHGSLENCLLAYDEAGDATVLSALTGFVAELTACGKDAMGHLVADPARGSPCKRWNLWLRWMVRHDRVDPGGWHCFSPARLIVPLDTHTWRVCRRLGLTALGRPSMRAALEITERFRAIRPEDPVRYDFALMRASLEGSLPA